MILKVKRFGYCFIGKIIKLHINRNNTRINLFRNIEKK